MKVAVNEKSLPNFSLFNDDESIYKPGAVYRGNELLGEFVRLEEGTSYGYIDDVVFSKDGRIQSIIVSTDRRYGYGLYAYPYSYGLYDPALGYYDMPYARSDISALKPFDYSALASPPTRRWRPPQPPASAAMKHKLINEGPERSFAVVLDAGDEPMSCLCPLAQRLRFAARRATLDRYLTAGDPA